MGFTVVISPYFTPISGVISPYLYLVTGPGTWISTFPPSQQGQNGALKISRAESISHLNVMVAVVTGNGRCCWMRCFKGMEMVWICRKYQLDWYAIEDIDIYIYVKYGRCVNSIVYTYISLINSRLIYVDFVKIAGNNISVNLNDLFVLEHRVFNSEPTKLTIELKAYPLTPLPTLIGKKHIAMENQ